MAMATLFAAVAAAGSYAVSKRLLEISQTAPPDISIVVADPLWQIGPLGSRLRISLVSTMHFFNQGARPGCLDGVVMQLERIGTIPQWRLAPTFFLNTARLFAAIEEQDRAKRKFAFTPVQVARARQFSPIIVPGKSEITHTIVFVNPIIPRSAFVEGGKYRLYWSTLNCREDDWILRRWSTYEIPIGEVPGLLSGELWTSISQEREKSYESVPPARLPKK